MFKDYEDKVVVVTGAGYGIGRSLALGCAKRGANIVINDIHGDAANNVVEEVKKLGRDAIAVQADVSLSEECQKIFDATMDKFGRIDMLINNAGVSAFGDVTEIVEQDIKWVTEVNVYSHWYMMGRFIPQMLKQKTHCQILNVCSIAGLITSATAPVYFSTKHAAVALSESTYKWLNSIDANIDISVFCPGFIQTEMYKTDEHRPERFKKTDDPFYTSEKYKQYYQLNKHVLTNGKPLEPIIEEVFEALEREQFYILTHPEYDTLLREQGEFQADMIKPIDLNDLAKADSVK